MLILVVTLKHCALLNGLAFELLTMPPGSNTEIFTVSGLHISSKRYEGAFHETGFTNWNDPGRVLKAHCKSDFHNESKMKLGFLENSTPINAILDRKQKQSRVTANQQLVIVIRALQLLSRQNIAIRGNLTEVPYAYFSYFHNYGMPLLIEN